MHVIYTATTNTINFNEMCLREERRPSKHDLPLQGKSEFRVSLSLIKNKRNFCTT